MNTLKTLYIIKCNTNTRYTFQRKKLTYIVLLKFQIRSFQTYSLCRDQFQCKGNFGVWVFCICDSDLLRIFSPFDLWTLAEQRYWYYESVQTYIQFFTSLSSCIIILTSRIVFFLLSFFFFLFLIRFLVTTQYCSMFLGKYIYKSGGGERLEKGVKRTSKYTQQKF